MPDITWDAAFEALPPDTLEDASGGPSRITQTKVGVREREELEHNFIAGVKPFHIAGACSVMYKGTTAQIAALTGVSRGCIAYDTDLSKLKMYYEVDGVPQWVVIATDHGALSGLTADDHPQYLHLDKASQTLMHDLLVEDNIKIDGRDINLDGSVIDTLPTGRGFGSWSGSYNLDTVYGPELKDCFVRADYFILYGSAYARGIYGLIGVASPPTIPVGLAHAYSALNVAALAFPVPRGYYWKVATSPTFTPTSWTVVKMEVS